MLIWSYFPYTFLQQFTWGLWEYKVWDTWIHATKFNKKKIYWPLELLTSGRGVKFNVFICHDVFFFQPKYSRLYFTEKKKKIVWCHKSGIIYYLALLATLKLFCRASPHIVPSATWEGANLVSLSERAKIEKLIKLLNKRKKNKKQKKIIAQQQQPNVKVQGEFSLPAKIPMKSFLLLLFFFLLHKNLWFYLGLQIRALHVEKSRQREYKVFIGASRERLKVSSYLFLSLHCLWGWKERWDKRMQYEAAPSVCSLLVGTLLAQPEESRRKIFFWKGLNIKIYHKSVFS